MSINRKALFLGILLFLAASAAASKMGRYPLMGVRRGQATGASAAAVSTGCTLPFTLPCELGA